MHVPPSVDTVDCAGTVIVDGFWNSHVHFTEPKWGGAANLPATQLNEQLQQMLTRYGFTSVVDTGSDFPNTVAIRRRIESGEVIGPRILTAGFPLYPKDGVPYYVVETAPPDLVKQLPQPSTPEEAVRAVDANIAGVQTLSSYSWSPSSAAMESTFRCLCQFRLCRPQPPRLTGEEN